MSRLRPSWLIALAALLAIVVLGGLVSAQAAAQGWLLAFVFASGFPIGATTLLMIGRLTGGRWLLAFEPELRGLSARTPWLFLFAVPLLLVPALAFRWAAEASATPDNLKAYLSPVFFAARTLAALAIWSALGLMFGRGRPSPVAAGVGLILHGALLIVISYDWILSVRPGTTASDMPMLMAAAQILSAAALVLVLVRGRPDPASADLAGFVAAMLLAIVYFGYMAFLVVWYGDLPERNGFMLARTAEPWTFVPAAALALGIAAVAVMGLDGRKRGPGRFVWSALLALAAWLVFLVWLMGADLAAWAPGFALLGAAAQLAWLQAPPAWPGAFSSRRAGHA